MLRNRKPRFELRERWIAARPRGALALRPMRCGPFGQVMPDGAAHDANGQGYGQPPGRAQVEHDGQGHDRSDQDGATRGDGEHGASIHESIHFARDATSTLPVKSNAPRIERPPGTFSAIPADPAIARPTFQRRRREHQKRQPAPSMVRDIAHGLAHPRHRAKVVVCVCIKSRKRASSAGHDVDRYLRKNRHGFPVPTAVTPLISRHGREVHYFRRRAGRAGERSRYKSVLSCA